MKFKVDLTVCAGGGACEATCPEVFELPGDQARVKLDPVPAELEARALEAEAACPVGAISHEG